jgi:hypothetical protein
MGNSIHTLPRGPCRRRQSVYHRLGRSIYKPRPHLRALGQNTNGKRTKNYAQREVESPPMESSSLRFLDEHGGSGSPGEKGSLVFEQSLGHLLTVQMKGADLGPWRLTEHMLAQI